MPMAGLGTRFKSKGYDLPKPLISVDGVPMFKKAVASLDSLDCPKEYSFVVRKEHVVDYEIDKIIKNHFAEPNIIVTNDPPIGAAVDCFRAKSTVLNEQAVVFMDCDLYFRSQTYDQTLKECLRNDANTPVAGAIVCFKSQDSRYSYARVDNGMVVETAEKRVISELAITGSYFFNSAQLIFKDLGEYISKQLEIGSKEYYLAPIYNRYIERGQKIKACLIDEYHSFGTPEELEIYEKDH
jgi:dTDP-glucose pyrophosphorylase